MFVIKGGGLGKNLTKSMLDFVTKHYECQMCKKELVGLELGRESRRLRIARHWVWSDRRLIKMEYKSFTSRS
jgi:hypothetical protein